MFLLASAGADVVVVVVGGAAAAGVVGVSAALLLLLLLLLLPALVLVQASLSCLSVFCCVKKTLDVYRRTKITLCFMSPLAPPLFPPSSRLTPLCPTALRGAHRWDRQRSGGRGRPPQLRRVDAPQRARREAEPKVPFVSLGLVEKRA